MSLFKKLLQKNIARKAIRTPSFLDRDRVPPPNQQPMTRALPIQITPGVTSPILELNGDDQIAVGRPVPPPPGFDDSELRRRLAALEGREIPVFDRDVFIKDVRSSINIPQFDPSALQGRIAELEGREVPTIDREGLIRDITGRIKQPRPFDPTRIRERLAALENRRPEPVRPLFDPSRLQA